MIILRVMEGRAVTSETWDTPPIVFQTNPSFNTSATVSPTSRLSLPKLNTDLNAFSLGRSSRTYLSPLDDIKHESISPVSQRSSWEICTQVSPFSIWDDGELGSVATLAYKDSSFSPSDSIASSQASPQTPPIALTPRHPCGCVSERRW